MDIIYSHCDQHNSVIDVLYTFTYKKAFDTVDHRQIKKVGLQI